MESNIYSVGAHPQPLTSTPAPLVWASLASITGIVLDRACAVPLAASLMTSLVALGTFVIIQRRARRPPRAGRPSPVSGHLSILIAIAALASSWHHVRWYQVGSQDLIRFAPERSSPCCLRGQVASGATYRQRSRLHAPDEIEVVTSFKSKVDAIRDGHRWRSVTGTCRIEVQSRAELPPTGTSVEVLGELSRPRQARNPGDFDPREDLRGAGIHAVLRANSPASLQRRAAAERSFILIAAGWRQSVRARIKLALDRQLEPQDAALASAMLLGNRQDIDEDQRAQFAHTGTSHLLSISGLHLGILAVPWFLLGRTGLLPMRYALLAAIVFSWSFCWLIEFRTPVTRAAILITIFCAAKLLGRPAFHWNTIALATLVVLLANPSELFATGAQLSFLAVITMAHVQRRSSRAVDPVVLLRRSAQPWVLRWLRQRCLDGWWSIRLSGLVWLTTAPLVAQQFHLLTPIAVLANPLTMLAISMALYSTSLAAFIDIIGLPFGMAFAGPAHVGFAWLRVVLEQGSQFPGAWHWTMGPASWWSLIFYIGLLGHFAGWTACLPKRWRFLLLAGWCIVGLVPDYENALRRSGYRIGAPTQVTFLDVGHGTAVLAELPNGQMFLYDAGSMGSDEMAAERISRFLWYRRIPHLDAVFITHADVDHYNGLKHLLDRFSIGVVYVEPSMVTRRIYPWESTRQRIHATGVPLEAISAGSTWHATTWHAKTWHASPWNTWWSPRQSAFDTAVSIMHPTPTLQTDRDNERSLVLDIRHEGQHVLLTGDLEGAALANWMKSQSNGPQVLMAPHHGSGLIPIRELMNRLRPDVVVISGGWPPRSSDVQARYSATGATTYHTATWGAITVRLHDGKTDLSGWLSPD